MITAPYANGLSGAYLRESVGHFLIQQYNGTKNGCGEKELVSVLTWCPNE